MTRDPIYTNATEYFKDTVSFLRNYQWLFSTPNTRIFTEKLLENFPRDWCDQFAKLSTKELNEIPFGYLNEAWPDSLKDFVLKLESLKPKYEICNTKADLMLPNQFFKGLSVKKKHEILALAPFIHEICQANNVAVIIDIGAGLGYLPQLLYEKYNYNVLAIDANEKHIKTAIKRQHDLYKSSINHIQYVHHFVDENSTEFLNQQLIKHFNHTNFVNTNVCLVGLHACADLTITLLRLFDKMGSVNHAVVMPCCYHRLKKNSHPNVNSEHFINFPVSRSLTEVFDCENAANFLTGAFLRLACQNTAASWRSMSHEDHQKHSVGAVRRAILQLVTETEGYQVRRLKRKSRISSAEFDSFPIYLDGLRTTHIVSNLNAQENLIGSEHFRQQLTEAWALYETQCRLVEIYSAFQTALQSVCEHLVLLDRVEMVKEGGQCCYLQKITDDCVSPRCYALVARQPGICK